MSRRHSRVSTAPMALASDGTVYVNAAHATDATDPRKLADVALAEGGAVFVGVEIKPRERMLVFKRLDDPFAEVAALVFGGRNHLRRRPR